jgi:hypothetical protein
MAKETRTYKDRAPYLINAVRLKRHRLKEDAVKAKGGKCVVCGYHKYIGALDLHHIKGKKEFTIGSTGYTYSKEKIRLELEKCILVCSNCHREIEAGITSVPQPSIYKFKML